MPDGAVSEEKDFTLPLRVDEFGKGRLARDDHTGRRAAQRVPDWRSGTDELKRFKYRVA
jgi:hypothetical protein